MKIPNDLLNSVRQCLTEPTFDIQENFSLEKSKLHYQKRVKQWDNWNYKQNLAVKKEEVSFDFGNLLELEWNAWQARNLYNNLKKEEFNKWVDWYIYGQNIVVMWYRLKTFDEWLHDWIKDALIMAHDCPEDWARMIIERELWEWHYTNTQVHMFAEWKIDKEMLERLWHYETYQSIDKEDIEKEIEKCVELLSEKDEKCEEGKETTVLTFKI